MSVTTPTTPKSIAALLTGIHYPVNIPKEIVAAAKEAGIVIVYGASDDLMEFEGAVHDEVGCADGGVAHVDAEGLLSNFEQLKDDGDEERLEKYFQRKPRAMAIQAVWDSEGYSWIYRTGIRHETFEVLEEGEGPYCRGIVFSLQDVAAHINDLADMGDGTRPTA